MKLYKVDINTLSDDDFRSAYASLQADKKDRVDRYKNIKDKKLSLAGDMLARKAFRDYGNNDVHFIKNEYSKPYAENTPYYFNISHSGDYSVCAISDKEIGVDIEKIRQINLKTAKRFSNEKELYFIFGKRPDEDDFSLKLNNETKDIFKRFFIIWTLKEAYFKMLSTGIASDLKSVEFEMTDKKINCNKPANIQLDLDTDGYIISICER